MATYEHTRTLDENIFFSYLARLNLIQVNTKSSIDNKTEQILKTTPPLSGGATWYSLRYALAHAHSAGPTNATA
jgi:hypothetical protein